MINYGASAIFSLISLSLHFSCVCVLCLKSVILGLCELVLKYQKHSADPIFLLAIKIEHIIQLQQCINKLLPLFTLDFSKCLIFYALENRFGNNLPWFCIDSFI